MELSYRKDSQDSEGGEHCQSFTFSHSKCSLVSDFLQIGAQLSGFVTDWFPCLLTSMSVAKHGSG